MRYSVLAVLVCLIAPGAAAERIRDMSLSIEQTEQEPDIYTDSNTGLGPIGSPHAQPIGGQGLSAQPLPGEFHATDPYQTPSELENRMFMASYCDTGFRPVVPVRGSMGTCLESIKQKACDGFSQLPPEIQGTVDRAVSCQYNMQERSDPYASEFDCSRTEHDQLRLVKQFWRDQNMTYVILFLPDLVVNPGIFCTREGQY